MSKRMWSYEYSDYRIYKCCLCGRTMHEPSPHICNGGFRQHGLQFKTKEGFDPAVCLTCARDDSRYCGLCSLNPNNFGPLNIYYNYYKSKND